MPRFSDSLGLLEGLTEDLSDSPFTRTDPIRKCGLAAQQYGFWMFAVSSGYCVSGSNSLTDYQYVQATACSNGIGGYSAGYFTMDVYEITNQQMFQDSVAETGHPVDYDSAPAPPTNESSSSSAEDAVSTLAMSSSVPGTCPGLLTRLAPALTMLALVFAVKVPFFNN